VSDFSDLNRDFLALANATSEGVALISPEPWRISFANASFRRGTGIRIPSLVNESGIAPVSDLIQRLEESLIAASQSQSPVCDWVLTITDKPFAARLFRIDDRENAPAICLVVRPIASDVADAMNARRDPLTLLHDRAFLLEWLTRMLGGNRAGDHDFAVLFIDLDQFKNVNDEYGHLVGDNVIREAAQRIDNSLREGDHVVRFGGDEFVAVVRGVRCLAEVEPVIDRLRSALAVSIAVPAGAVRLSVSVGVALAAEGYATAEDLIAAADRAMYRAKLAE
jgi:diguanylate cyclase (GGDEF)-like protein